MKASDLLVKCLETEGVKYIFGLPGEEVEDLLFSLENSSLKLITTRHEQGAAFMADVWGRLTGKAGVCLATLGPGATNLITGLADASMDKSPVVAITGQGDTKRLHKESHQYIDVVNMLRPIVKWNFSIQEPTVLAEVVRKAFKLAQIEKPGVTHLELPEDIAEMEVDEKETPLTPNTIRRAAPDYKAINQALELLSQARRPIILAGNGAVRKLASKHLRMFVEKTKIPVASTFMGKGAVSDRNPFSLHAVGLQSKDYPLYAFEKADLILTVGFDIAELYPATITMMNPQKNKKIIHIDFAPAEIYEYYDPDVEIVADISATLWELNEKLATKNLRFDQQWFLPMKQAFEKDVQGYNLKTNDQLTVPGVLAILRKALNDDDIVISDVGAHKIWVGRNFPVYEPSTCIISNGFASMGIALPGGIAAKLASPTKNVVAVMGDGGFLMNSQELETAKRISANFTVIVFCDNDYGLISWKQKSHLGKSTGTTLSNPDFVKYAKSFGIDAFAPGNTKELEEVFQKTLKSNQLSLIAIQVNPSVNVELTQKLKNNLL